MLSEYEVWAILPRKEKIILIANFSSKRWQWAMKLLGYLEDKGYTDIKIIKKG